MRHGTHTHTHVHLLNGRAKRAEVYPDQLCNSILKGLLKQMKHDCRMQDLRIGAVMPEDEARAFDDQSGEELDFDRVLQARAEEMAEIAKHGVYIKVPVSERWEVTGKGPVKTRWIDINKGDKLHPEYRSRFVAKDFNDSKRDDLFAATPPLEAVKLLLSLYMTEGIGWSRSSP